MDFKFFKQLIKLAADDNGEYMKKPSLDKFIELQVPKEDGQQVRIIDLPSEQRNFYVHEFLNKTKGHDNDLSSKLNEMENALTYIEENAPEGSDLHRIMPVLNKIIKQ